MGFSRSGNSRNVHCCLMVWMPRSVPAPLASLLLALLAAGCAGVPGPSVPTVDATRAEPLLVAAGEVADRSAVLWARAPAPGSMTVTVDGQAVDTAPVRVDAYGDYTGQVMLDGLEPARAYRYNIAVAHDDGTHSRGGGRFRTAPAPGTAATVRFLFGGDLAGQNVCRDVERGFPIFTALADRQADFFIGLGDMIYADTACEAQGAYGNDQLPIRAGVARTLPEFHANWRYTFGDPDFARLRERMGYYAVWDDHEVINDFSAQVSGRDDGPALLPMGLAAFRQYNPLVSGPDDAGRLYRRFRWGRHVELFLLDNRQYRDDKSVADSAAKTMLGADQRRWLARAVGASTATWKIVVTSVPLSIPTGWPPGAGRDGWADGGETTGYEHELLALLGGWREAGLRNLLWLTADVHFATGLALRPFEDDPDFVMHELIAGPLNAGLFAKRDLDDTLRPQRLFFHGPEDFRDVMRYEDAIGWMNAGQITIDDQGHIAFELIDAHGNVVARQRFVPQR